METGMVVEKWWSYPMKPVQVSEAVLGGLDLAKYSMEKKFDGWRAIVIAEDGGRTSLWTRERRRIEMPTGLEAELRGLGLPRGTVLDGEIWNPLKRGGWKHAKGVECKLTLWDAIRDGGKDLGGAPLEERRGALRRLVPDGTLIQVAEVLPVSLQGVRAVHEEAKLVREGPGVRSGFIHGVVIKRNASPRRDHATRSVEHADWMKIVFPAMSGWAPR